MQRGGRGLGRGGCDIVCTKGCVVTSVVLARRIVQATTFDDHTIFIFFVVVWFALVPVVVDAIIV